MKPATSPFATIEEALDDIRAGKFVVVVDDEDRENEGDLTIAAAVRHARGRQLHGDPRPRPDLPLPHARALPGARTAPDDRPRTRRRTAPPSRSRRGARRRLHRDLGARPGPHDPGRDRSRARPRTISSSPGHVFPLRGASRRRAPARRADRGRRRPRAARGPAARRCRLRGDERGRDDGARPGSREVLRAARPEDDHGRRPDRVPAPDRAARRARRLGAAAHGLRRLHRDRLPRADSRASSTSRSCAAMSTVRRTSSSASTRNASPATSSTRSAATAASSSTSRCARIDAGGLRRAPLPRPGGTRDRAAQQAQGLRAAGERASTPWRRTSRSASRQTRGSTASDSQILADLGLTTIRMLTNNPKKISGLAAFGLDVVEQVPIEVVPNEENRRLPGGEAREAGALHRTQASSSGAAFRARTRETTRERPLRRQPLARRAAGARAWRTPTTASTRRARTCSRTGRRRSLAASDDESGEPSSSRSTPSRRAPSPTPIRPRRRRPSSGEIRVRGRAVRART